MKLGLTTTTGKIVASVAVLGVAASVAGLGTFGAFTATTSASTTVATGTVSLALGPANSATNRLTIGASGLVPGDTMQRAVDLTSGTQALTTVGLTTTASTSSTLDTDATNGLQMVVDSCTVPWTETGSSAPFTYSCSGTTSHPVTTTRVTQSGSLGALAASSTDHLRVTLTLPSSASTAQMGQSSTILFTFAGTPRAGTDQ